MFLMLQDLLQGSPWFPGPEKPAGRLSSKVHNWVGLASQASPGQPAHLGVNQKGSLSQKPMGQNPSVQPGCPQPGSLTGLPGEPAWHRLIIHVWYVWWSLGWLAWMLLGPEIVHTSGSQGLSLNVDLKPTDESRFPAPSGNSVFLQGHPHRSFKVVGCMKQGPFSRKGQFFFPSPG